MSEELHSARITEYYEAVLAFSKATADEGLAADSVPFGLLLRPFHFLNEHFEDLEVGLTACMPVFTGFVLGAAITDNTEYSSDKVKKLLNVAAAYLDCGKLEIEEHEDPADLLQPPYDFSDKLSRMGNVTQIHPMIEEQEERLKAAEHPELLEWMALEPGKRIERYEEIIQAVVASKNTIYQLIRKHGDKLLTDIEATINTLIPADQDQLLHGLDAFPKHGAIMDFLQQFIAQNEGRYIAGQAQKYLDRIAAGVITTGNER
jgi:hypothetical protein